MIDDIKRLSKNSILFALGNILTQALGFFLLPLYTRILTPSDYGILSVLSVFSNVLTIFLVFGQDSAIARYYYVHNNNRVELKSYLSSVMLITMVISFIVCSILTIFGEPLFSLIMPDITQLNYIILVIWTTFFSVPICFSLQLFQVREKSLEYSTFSILKFLFSTILIIYLIVVLKKGVLGKIEGDFLGVCLIFIISLWVIKKDITLSFDLKHIINSYTYGIPLIPHLLASWIMNLSDRLIIAMYCSYLTVGLYSLGYQIGSLLGMVTGAINFAWVPFFMSTASIRPNDAKQIFSRLTSYYIVIILLCALLIVSFSKEILQIMTTPDYYLASSIVPFIVISFIFSGVYYAFVNQIFFVKKTGYLFVITASAAILNLILNFLLVPQYSMYGSAIATIISSLYTCIMVAIIAGRVYPIKYEYRRILIMSTIYIPIFLLVVALPDYGFLLNIIIKNLLVVIYSLYIYTMFLSTDERKQITAYLYNVSKKPSRL